MPDTAVDERLEGPPEAAPGGPAGDQTATAEAATQGHGPGGGGGVAIGERFFEAVCIKNDPGLLGRERGGLTTAVDRRKALENLDAAVAVGARARVVANLLGVGLTTPCQRAANPKRHHNGVNPNNRSNRVPTNLTLKAVTARKDDVPAADQAASTNLAGLMPISGGGGLIQTTSG